LSTEELSARVGIHSRGARDFFDALFSIGLLSRDKDNRYSNTVDSDYFLDASKPESYIGDSFRFLGSRGYPEWANLTRALVTGKRQSEGTPEEEDLFSGLYKDPERMKIFLQGMTSSTTRFAQSIAREFPW